MNWWQSHTHLGPFSIKTRRGELWKLLLMHHLLESCVCVFAWLHCTVHCTILCQWGKLYCKCSSSSWVVKLWMKVLVGGKLGKSNNERSDVFLTLIRLHYNSCSKNRFFINFLCSIVFKEASTAKVQVQSTSELREGSWSNEACFSFWSRINREPCACPLCCHESSATRSS